MHRNLSTDHGCHFYIGKMTTGLGIFSWHHGLLTNCRRTHGVCYHCIMAAAQSRCPFELEKCKFFKRKIDFLGHVVCPGQLVLASHITDAIGDSTKPRTVTELKSFLDFLVFALNTDASFLTSQELLSHLTLSWKWGTFYFQQFVNFGFLEFPCFRTCTIWGAMHSSFLCWIQFYLVFAYIDSSQVVLLIV